jgi:hypothetical protein
VSVFAADPTPTTYDLGPDQTIRMVPLNQTCTIKDPDTNSQKMLTYTLTKAFRIRSLPDVPTYVYYYMQLDNPGIGTDDFVVFEAKSNQNYLNRRMRIVRPDSIYAPQGFDGNHGVWKGEWTTTYAAFPVKPDEQAFNFLFCSYDAPIRIPLDFSKAETKMGNYSRETGLTYH